MRQIEMFMSTEDTQLTTLTSLERKREKTRIWKEKNPKRQWAGAAYKGAKFRAKGKGLPFNLTIDYLLSIVTDSCPVFNTVFKFSGNKFARDESPSLDRIDPAKGYVQGNVVVISNKANNIKSAYKSKDLYKVAEWLEQIEATSV
jgi:hypothetical protein